jgi:hypothetical protein
VLEHDDKMDQFEDVDHPFATAGTLTMGDLRFWPGVALPTGAIEDIALLKAQEFLKLVAKHFTSKKTDPAISSASVLRATAKVFGKKSGQLVELAAILAASFAFPTSP